MPIARSEVAFDTTPYVNHAKKCTDKTISMLYIVARGYNNIFLARYPLNLKINSFLPIRQIKADFLT